jgi:hypothetical protein
MKSPVPAHARLAFCLTISQESLFCFSRQYPGEGGMDFFD